MKKITLLALALALATACEKETPLATVTFNIGGVRTGDIATKGSPSDILSSTAPSGAITLTIASTTNSERVLTASVGQTVSLAYDTYTVTGTYTPSDSELLGLGYAYPEPSYSVSTTISVESGVSTYTLPATYSCFALILDKAEMSKYTYYSALTRDFAEFTKMVEDSEYGVVYVSPLGAWKGAQTLDLKSHPLETVDHEVTPYTLSTVVSSGCHKVENGKWYIFSPDEVVKQSGSIGVELPEWTEGE